MVKFFHYVDDLYLQNDSSFINGIEFFYSRQG